MSKVEFCDRLKTDTEFLTQEVWSGAWEFVFITHLQRSDGAAGLGTTSGDHGTDNSCASQASLPLLQRQPS
jgi:hypothetical protein